MLCLREMRLSRAVQSLRAIDGSETIPCQRANIYIAHQTRQRWHWGAATGEAPMVVFSS